MAQLAMHNLTIPVPNTIYNKLTKEAKRSQQPATVLVVDAIEQWLKQREKELLHQQIAAYAKIHAGSNVDLDEELELASIEHLLEESYS